MTLAPSKATPLHFSLHVWPLLSLSCMSTAIGGDLLDARIFTTGHCVDPSKLTRQQLICRRLSGRGNGRAAGGGKC